MSDIPEIQAREDALQAMRDGAWEGVEAAQVQAALEAAEADRTGGYGGRVLGFGMILARPVHEGGDWQEFVVAVTDGERQAQMVVRLSGSALPRIDNTDEARWEHVRERLQNAAGSLPNDGRRYENVLLHHPLHLGA
jgi:hypothetical protein